MGKLFRVFECDDYGHPRKYFGVFKANDEMDAREIASKHYENEEMVTTGFYGAKEISMEQLLIEKNDAVIDLVNKFEIFN